MSVIEIDSKKKRANHQISEDKERSLQELFLMDGITPFQAARIVGVKFDTAKRYFEMWCDELIEDPEHETWVQRQRRVRVRSLEGYAKKIIAITEQRNIMEKILVNLTFTRDEKTKGDTVSSFIGMKDNAKNLKFKSPEDLQHDLILSYNTKIAVLNQQLLELQDKYDAVDSQPPAIIILQKEMADMLNEIQSSAGV